ncbi:MAG: ACT domain-containing protein [Pleomorphochaeta sp.]
MKIRVNRDDYAICRLSSNEDIPSWCKIEDFVTITKTEDELSLVLKSNQIPDNIKCEKGWNILKIVGPLDFSLIGILSKLSTILADNNIGIFVISTFDTDYILIKKENTNNAIRVLSEKGYLLEEKE